MTTTAKPSGKRAGRKPLTKRPKRPKRPSALRPARLLAIRERLKLGQGQLGFLLGYEGESSRAIISRMENGQIRIPKPQAMLAVALDRGWRPADFGERPGNVAPMTGGELEKLRLTLDLDREQMGRQLGFEGSKSSVVAMIWRLETGERPLRPVHIRLSQALAAGFAARKAAK